MHLSNLITCLSKFIYIYVRALAMKSALHITTIQHPFGLSTLLRMKHLTHSNKYRAWKIQHLYHIYAVWFSSNDYTTEKCSKLKWTAFFISFELWLFSIRIFHTAFGLSTNCIQGRNDVLFRLYKIFWNCAHLWKRFWLKRCSLKLKLKGMPRLKLIW